MEVTTHALIPHVKCNIYNIYNSQDLNYHDFPNKWIKKTYQNP
jgi:hypothetical protein